MRNAVIVPSEGIHSKLLLLLGIIGDIMWADEKMQGAGIEVTGGHRPDGMIPGDSGVHSTDPLRALDLRLVDQFSRGVLPDEVHARVCRRLNRDWLYDPEQPEKPVALYHDAHTGWHIHLQVTRDTRRKE